MKKTQKVFCSNGEQTWVFCKYFFWLKSELEPENFLLLLSLFLICSSWKKNFLNRHKNQQKQRRSSKKESWKSKKHKKYIESLSKINLKRIKRPKESRYLQMCKEKNRVCWRKNKKNERTKSSIWRKIEFLWRKARIRRR